MLLLDKNNLATNTVYYLAAVIHGYLSIHPLLSFSELYDGISQQIHKDKPQFDFFVLALDLLFLLDKISINNKGELIVS